MPAALYVKSSVVDVRVHVSLTKRPVAFTPEMVCTVPDTPLGIELDEAAGL